MRKNTSSVRLRIFPVALMVTVVALIMVASNLYGSASTDPLHTLLSNAENGAIITLDADKDLAGMANFTGGKSVVVDLNGNTITMTNEAALFNISNASVTFKNGIITTDRADSSMFSLTSSANLYFYNMQVSGVNSCLFYAYGDNNNVYASGTTLTFNSLCDPNQNFVTIYDADNDPVEHSSITSPHMFLVSAGSAVSPGGNNASASSSSYESTVKANVTGSYSVSVPTTIDFGNITYATSEADRYTVVSAEINVSYMVTSGEELILRVSGEGAGGTFVISSGSNNINFVILDASGNEVQPNGVVARFSQAGKQTIKLKLDKTTLSAVGQYTGTLTFDATIE